MYDPSDSFVPFFWECIASCHILLQSWKPQTGTTRCQNLQNASFEIPLPPKTEYRENMFLFATQVTQHSITAPGSQSKHHLYLHSFGQPDMSPDLKSISLKRYDFSSDRFQLKTNNRWVMRTLVSPSTHRNTAPLYFSEDSMKSRWKGGRHSEKCVGGNGAESHE